MITLSSLKELPYNTFLLEIDGELPKDVVADFLFITPTLKVRKYFIILGEVGEYERGS